MLFVRLNGFLLPTPGGSDSKDGRSRKAGRARGDATQQNVHTLHYLLNIEVAIILIINRETAR